VTIFQFLSEIYIILGKFSKSLDQIRMEAQKLVSLKKYLMIFPGMSANSTGTVYRADLSRRIASDWNDIFELFFFLS